MRGRSGASAPRDETTVTRWNWLADFEIAGGVLLVKKTGHRLRIDPPLVADFLTWLPYFGFVQGWRVLRAVRGRRGPKVAFLPDRARPWYLIWPVLQAAGVRIVEDVAEADIVFHFDDSTVSEAAPPPAATTARLVNFACRDVSKSHVANVFEQVFGYGLAVDPATYSGPMVIKSEANAAHDGRIVEGPQTPEPGFAYQRLIDNEIDGGLVEDLRCVVVGGRVAALFRKRRPLERRFKNENVQAILDDPRNALSPEELDRIARFAAALGLDWGGVDVLRDRADGRIYIVDANKTDMGPPIALPLMDKLKATARLARAFAAAYAPQRSETSLASPDAAP